MKQTKGAKTQNNFWSWHHLHNFALQYLSSKQYLVKRGADKILTWSKAVTCLRFVNQNKVPDATEKIKLSSIGLGYKEMIFNLVGDCFHIHDIIINAFPQILNTGGCLFDVKKSVDVLLDPVFEPSFFLNPQSNYNQSQSSPLSEQSTLETAKMPEFQQTLQVEISTPVYT